MIKLEDFEGFNELPFYYPDGAFFGHLNDFQVAQLRFWIIKDKIDGFYCVENNIKNYINTNGDFSDGYPIELDQDMFWRSEIFKLKKNEQIRSN